MIEQIKIDFDKILNNLKLSKENVDLRKKNLSEFIKIGFPNNKNENWKFSDLNKIIASQIKNLKFYNKELIRNTREQPNLIDMKNPKFFEHNKIIVVDGVVERIDFETYEDVTKINIINTIENEISKKKQPLVYLNNAFATNYLKIIIKKDYSLKKPVILYNITSPEMLSTNINQRIDFVLEENSKMSLINFFLDDGKNNFINIFQNFNIEKNAIFKNYKFDTQENNNLKYVYNEIDLKENSLVENFIISKGSKFFKNEIICNLKEKYGSVFVNGIIDLKNNQHHEIKTNINHLNENSKSYQLIKSVLSDNSRGVFQGKIFVDSIAQKTDGYQLSKALLLNENCEFNAKPELEIYADDVKCSHGSTSGNLDENAIFYMMSRGLTYEKAKKLLINGFFLDVTDKITDPQVKLMAEILMEIEK